MTKVTINDCGADCGCHDTGGLDEVGNNVWVNPKGSSGPSEKMLRMIAKKQQKQKEQNKSIKR